MNRRVYVAGSRRELARARRAVARLCEHGVEVTYDWTVAPGAEASADSEPAEGEARDIAERCIAGVRAADVFWLLAPDRGGFECWVELGAVLGGRQFAPVLTVVSGDIHRSVFVQLVGFRTPSDCGTWRTRSGSVCPSKRSTA